MTTASEFEHDVEVVTDEDGHRYRAQCWCGWTSEWSRYDNEADAAAEDHREVVTDPEPGDAFDRFMSDLLDLQDEIARALMWLAEHWSVDLPVPKWSGGGTAGAEVVVRVYCQSLDQLDQAVAVLDRMPVDDRANDIYGNRYRSARRRFGRVRIDAYAALPAISTESAA